MKNDLREKVRCRHSWCRHYQRWLFRGELGIALSWREVDKVPGHGLVLRLLLGSRRIFRKASPGAAHRQRIKSVGELTCHLASEKKNVTGERDVSVPHPRA
jgi:hypothetical protein